MQTFNEWLGVASENPDFGMVTKEDGDLVTNQLSMFVDRIAGVLHHVSEEKKHELVEKLISQLRERTA